MAKCTRPRRARPHRDRCTRHIPALDRAAIAVLPFAISRASRSRNIFPKASARTSSPRCRAALVDVIARNSRSSTSSNPSTSKDRRRARRRHVVEGGVRKDGDHVRITAQLVDVATGSHLWAERYDRDLADVSLCRTKSPRPSSRRSSRSSTPPRISGPGGSAGQHGCVGPVMRALSHYWRVTRQAIWSRRRFWKRRSPSTRSRPGAQPAGFLPYVQRPYGLAGNATAVPLAERAALAAIRADSEDAWAHYALASVYLFHRRFHDCIAELNWRCVNPSFSPRASLWRCAGLSRTLGGRRSRRARGAEILTRDPFARSIAASPPIASMSAKITRRRSGVARSVAAARRLRRRHRVLTAPSAWTAG